MKWTKIRAGVYRSGKYELRQARWRASNDGWLITTDDESFHDSARLLSKAKRRAETHAAAEAKNEAKKVYARGTARCKTCQKACTTHTGDYYMVHDAVWQQAKMGSGIVCLGCLEQALGRKLVKADFTECLLNHLNGYLRADLIAMPAMAFCDLLRVAAQIGVTDAAARLPSRSAHDLAALLCERQKYCDEHVRMLHEAYESGQMFIELRRQPTNMTWGTTTERSGTTEHGSYKVRVTKGKP